MLFAGQEYVDSYFIGATPLSRSTRKVAQKASQGNQDALSLIPPKVRHAQWRDGSGRLQPSRLPASVRRE